ncbi:hypothetical protein [Chitinophaga sp. ARDCPP14]|uniref:hypothetical protein n=1 Tax=Chitinophaga sp. ARDCPP14 TaxID=3391139 RepID=UPI003F528B7B
MRNSICIYIFLIVYLSLGCNNKVNNPDKGAAVSMKGGDSNMLNSTDSFKIDAIEFVKQDKIVDTIDLKSMSKRITCSNDYTALKEEEIVDEFRFFETQILCFNYKGDIRGGLSDSSFVTAFYKKTVNENEEYFQVEQLRFLKIDSMEVAGYGDCIIASFEYLNPSSANQDKPTVMFNTERNEAVVWNFSDWGIRKGMIELDFKVRGGKHTLYKVEYDDKIRNFIPTCYKIIASK